MIAAVTAHAVVVRYDDLKYSLMGSDVASLVFYDISVEKNLEVDIRSYAVGGVAEILNALQCMESGVEHAFFEVTVAPASRYALEAIDSEICTLVGNYRVSYSKSIYSMLSVPITRGNHSFEEEISQKEQ